MDSLTVYSTGDNLGRKSSSNLIYFTNKVDLGKANKISFAGFEEQGGCEEIPGSPFRPAKPGG
jgi:hypothetical protein